MTDKLTDMQKFVVKYNTDLWENRLTHLELRLVKKMKNGEALSTSSIIHLFDMCGNNASNVLTKLHKKKFTNRSRVPNPLGGYKYVYTLKE